MYKKLIIAAAFAVLTANTGCATAFASETLVSELVNDHEPGTRSPPHQAPALTWDSGLALAEASPAGSACNYGGDCRSSLCEENVCVRTTLEERYDAVRPVQIAVTP